MGALTTHVLDTSTGTPGRGIRYDLYRSGPEPRHLAGGTTNDDGRCPQPLLEGEAFEAGTYDLVFQAADYFEAQGHAPGESPFLGEVVIRFGVDDPARHYHVPLLLSRFGYTTYRGS
ncbi:hydroxyisourate hydrolase [Elongatibacter sediminis]|uniref:5-hydroxyisourate hydrolase n=1 Tax=Elongatibacter sediminis TaxID=3119006 RepID=A0AAW9RQ91_9GAMM